MNKKILIIILAVVAIGILVKINFFPGDFRYAGTLEATKVEISAQVPSRIESVKIQEGDHIKMEEELVTLSCEDIKIAADLANQNYNRANRLFRSGSGSRETLDLMKNRKEDADVKVSWCLIKSPIQGIVLNRYHEPGELVMPGTKLLTLANIKDIWAYIYVPQTLVNKLKPGMKLNAYLPEMNDKLFVGKILKVNDEAEFTPKNVQTRTERERLVFGVKVSFLGSNEDEILKPGMTIEIDLNKD